MKKICFLSFILLLSSTVFAQPKSRRVPYQKYDLKYPDFRKKRMEWSAEITILKNMNNWDMVKNRTYDNQKIVSVRNTVGGRVGFGYNVYKRFFAHSMHLGVEMNPNGFKIYDINHAQVLLEENFTNYYLYLKSQLGVVFNRRPNGSLVDVKLGLTPLIGLNKKSNLKVLYDTYTLTPGGEEFHSPILYSKYNFGNNPNVGIPFSINLGLTATYQTRKLFGNSSLRIGLEVASKMGGRNIGSSDNQAEVVLFKGKGDGTILAKALYTDLHLYTGLVLGLTF